VQDEKVLSVSESLIATSSEFHPVASDEEALPLQRYTWTYELRIIEQTGACTIPCALASFRHGRLRRHFAHVSALAFL
jgi:hypothetical protein